MKCLIVLNHGKIGYKNIIFKIFRIIAGVGNYLMLYEFGKENLTKIT